MHRTHAQLAAVGLWLSLAALAAAPASAQIKPDNTKTNERDRDTAQPTADQQQNNETDLAITRDIRRAIIADKSLSTYAHNIKVITQNGAVTLKGPVRTEGEKQSIEAKAVDVAGAGHVTADVSIVPETTK